MDLKTIRTRVDNIFDEIFEDFMQEFIDTYEIESYDDLYVAVQYGDYYISLTESFRLELRNKVINKTIEEIGLEHIKDICTATHEVLDEYCNRFETILDNWRF